MKSNSIIYNSGHSKSTEQAVHYSKTHDNLARYLAYRDIPFIINKYSKGKKALDYGSGAGYSSNFISKLEFDVTGVDVDIEMLKQSEINYPHISFQQIQNRIIPFEPQSFDVIFSSFVLFEMSSADKIINYMKEAKRVLKNNGVFVALTGSEHANSLSREWLIYNNNYSQNENLKSGSSIKLYDLGSEIEFTDYYWTENDYRQFFMKSGLSLQEIYYPLGHKDEPYQWRDETSYSPFVILVATR